MKMMIKKILGLFAYYLPPPINKRVHKLRGVKIKDLSTLFIGSNVNIDHAYPEEVEIGANVTIASGARITAHNDPPKAMREILPASVEKISIGSNVYIGADAIVLEGVKIEDWTVVGAGAIVTKDVPKYKIVAGNPARTIGDLRDREKHRKG